jgi:phosphoglycolate phosphatase-like HAD superfamily hydrolase
MWRALVDSVPQNLRSLQDAFERHGCRVPYQTLQLYSSLDGNQALQLMLPEITERERAEIIAEKGTIYERHYLASIKPFNGVRDLFKSLSDREDASLSQLTAKAPHSNAICRLWTRIISSQQLPAAMMSNMANLIPAL